MEACEANGGLFLRMCYPLQKATVCCSVGNGRIVHKNPRCPQEGDLELCSQFKAALWIQEVLP